MILKSTLALSAESDWQKPLKRNGEEKLTEKLNVTKTTKEQKRKMFCAEYVAWILKSTLSVESDWRQFV